MRRAELDRKLVPLQACWGFFDEVAAHAAEFVAFLAGFTREEAL